MDEPTFEGAKLDWNQSIEIHGSEDRVSADAGTLLIREILEHSRIAASPEENLIDDRASGFGCSQHREPDAHVPLAALPGAPGTGSATTRRWLRQRSHREALSTAMDAMACRSSQQVRASQIS